MTDDAIRVVALVPARDEEATVARTVEALRGLGLDEVVVVDDGSSDGTSGAALAAGATVLRIPGHAGKGGAVDGAIDRLPPADVWLFADADLGSSAGGARLAARRRAVRARRHGRRDLPAAVRRRDGIGEACVGGGDPAVVSLPGRGPALRTARVDGRVPGRRPSARRRVRHGDGDDDRRGQGGVPRRRDPGRRPDPSRHRPDAPRLPPPRTPGAADRTGLDGCGRCGCDEGRATRGDEPSRRDRAPHARPLAGGRRPRLVRGGRSVRGRIRDACGVGGARRHDAGVRGGPGRRPRPERPARDPRPCRGAWRRAMSARASSRCS